MRKGSKAKRDLLVNIAVLGITALVWAALASPVSVTAMAGSGRYAVSRTQSRAAALQCVVDWDASAVEEIAEILRGSGAVMTFAVTGEWAKTHPELTARLSEAGNEISVLAGDAEYSADVVEGLTGIRPTVCTLTGGLSAPSGFIPVSCTLDLDCGRGSAEEIAKRLDGNLLPGSIIRISPTAELARALPEIIKIIKNMGLDIVPTYKMLYN